jgi:sulfur-oxidizing protein SoxA
MGGGTVARKPSIAIAAVALAGVAGLTLTPDLWAQAKEPAPLYTQGSAAPEPWTRYRGWNAARWNNYNTLADRHRTPPVGQPIKINGAIAGDAKKGQELAFSRARGGGCLACHVMGTSNQEAPGNVGPDLSEIGNAGHSDERLFNYVYDARTENPDAVMPPWGAHGFYSEAEIRDIVAFLKTLKSPAVFKNPLDDPNQRPLPVEDRDALDPFVNPGAERIEVGEGLMSQPGPNGKSCISCHANAKSDFVGWAVTMPKWEPRLNNLLGVEEFIYRHAKATIGADYRMQSAANTDLTVYLHALSNGKPINVDVNSPAMKTALTRGEALFNTKIGQFNLGCADCHTPERGAYKWIRGQYLGEPKGQLDHFPNWRTSRNEIWDIRKRLQWCNVQVRANELPPDAPEYAELELYLKSKNQGLALTAPNIRH